MEEMALSDVIKNYPQKRVVAGNGTNSHVNYILGPPGESVKIEVPTGITIYKDDKQIGNIKQS